MAITKADVLDVLGDLRLRNIHFFVGPITISSTEYDKVADHITAETMSVKPSSNAYSQYIPQANTLMTAAGSAPLRITQRSNLLHECTHAVTDINKTSVTRLTDEAAAYLAEMTYLLILDPSASEPPIGPPLNNMTRLAMQLARKYQLGTPGGRGVTVSDGDVSSLAQAIQRIPDYANIKEKDLVAADGVSPGGENELTYHRLQVSRMVNRQMDEDMRRHVEEVLTVHVRYSAHENFVTSDPQLLSLFEQYAGGGPSQKLTMHKKLLHIFLTVSQSDAQELYRRLATLRKGDSLSERFQRGFAPEVRSGLLAALQLQR